MNAPVNFHHQLCGRSKIINDVPVNGHLAEERDAQRAAGKLPPQDGFRVRRVVPHEVSALSEQRLILELLTRLIAHGTRPKRVRSFNLATHVEF